MGQLDEEQQAALRNYKQEVLGLGPDDAVAAAAAVSPPRIHVRQDSTSRRKRETGQRGHGKYGPAILLSEIAQETGLKVQDLIRESRRAGIQLSSKPRQTRLFPEEAAHLRRFAAGPPKPKPLTRANYRPDPWGRISLYDYDRLEQGYVGRLQALGHLPARRDVKRFPNGSWTEIMNHHRRLVVQQTERNRAYAAEMQRNGAPSAATPATAPQRAVTSPQPKASTPLTTVVSSPLAADIKRQIDVRRHRRDIDPESAPEPAGIMIATPRTDSIPTTIGPGNPALEELQLTLRNFAPKDHPAFFRSVAAVLELDERNVRALSSNTDPRKFTDRAVRSLIRLVCRGKFGLFAYHEVSNTLRSAARRSSRSATPKDMQTALTNLRPMHTGVLTDAGKSRFIFWHVEQDASQLAIITFGAMSDWVQGMGLGQYVPLCGRLITLSRHVKLNEMNQEDAQFMAEAAVKLRKGIHIRRSAPASPEPRSRNYLDSRTSAPQRTLTYKPHSDWLIPVVIENGFATAGLREDFFSNYGGRSAHVVREFYRRAPGSSWNDPKTVLVSAHTRGGYDVGDISFMPTVTIMREK